MPLVRTDAMVKMAKTALKALAALPALLVRTDKMVAMAKMAKTVIKAHVV